MSEIFDNYIKSIERDLRSGRATEYSYRGAFETYMEALASGIHATNDPRHIDVGAPDFIVEKGRVPLGYVETKDVGVNLDQVERSEQMKRYLPALHNLILTDYLEFRWYVNGTSKGDTVVIATAAPNGKLTPTLGAELRLEALFKNFYATETPTVRTPKELAQRLAGITRFIRKQIIQVLDEGAPELKESLNNQYKIFADLLLPNLTHEEFADLYAQAMTYGLFAAKLAAADAPFNFDDAYKYLRSNPFMQQLFQEVDRNIEGIAVIHPYLQDIVSLLNRAEPEKVFADFGKRTRTEDAVVHFYETFLAAYDPKLRESRGVYYTPEPVVQFIVRSVDELLKTRFDKPWGLADSSVKVLDPACGTGTFLYFVIQQIFDEIVNKRGQAGQWTAKSREMLRRLFGFELLLPPYVVSHLKLDRLMGTLGAPIGSGERLHVYLTNTLEEASDRADQLAGMGLNIAQESSAAAKVKRDDEIMVVLGNPPYSANSANSGEWISNLVREGYYPHDEIKEQNPKLLLDDYVKFIRFGEWRITKTGHGILAFITNHGYLDNPTFRGMRKHLMQTFDELFVFDLHGNCIRKEKTPDGKKDENVFDIRPGVAILIAVKNKQAAHIEKRSSKVFYSDLWGIRENKYQYLEKWNVSTHNWELLKPDAPFFQFKRSNVQMLPEYQSGMKIIDIFEVNSTGIKTHRDHFAIDFDQDKLQKRINDFVGNQFDDQTIRDKYDLPDTRDWKLHSRRVNLRRKRTIESSYKQVLYRPFDVRHVFFDENIIELPRFEVMNHLQQNNLALLVMRRIRTFDYCHFLVSDTLLGKDVVSTEDACYVLPLYLYTTPEESAGTLFAQTETTRRPNLSPAFIESFSQKLKLQFITDGQGDLKSTFGPEDVFYYAYAVFHSPTYRTRYAEFLKIDFPRLPLTGDKILFAKLVALGKELVEFHLLKTPKVDNFITTYPVPGGGLVDKVKYENDKVWINAEQYFGGVPAEVWNFKIGGYQVCDKWLKDRKGRLLSGEDVTHYQCVVVALKETIRLMSEVDKAIPTWPMD